MKHQPDAVPAIPILKRLFGLQGRVAAIVGGAGRIGRVLSAACAEAGADVAVVDVDAAAAEECAARSSTGVGGRSIAVQADATQADSLDGAVETITQAFGPPNILINAAQFRGTGFYSSRPEDYPLRAWQQVLDVNLTGVFLACQAFGRSMAAHGGGRIINLASTYGVVSADPRIYGDSGVNSPVSYAAAKAGVIQMTRYLAVHWREQRILVNCLVPGGVYDAQDSQFVENYCARTPLNRMASAEDYQGPVLFMASEASRYMTGAVVTVDGGWTAW